MATVESERSFEWFIRVQIPAVDEQVYCAVQTKGLSPTMGTAPAVFRSSLLVQIAVRMH
ncbi:hypothetical protein [Halococcoides cellulosivorans]|uniref:hypothetical protein n=1 Tax=Halococcoides cellulosivorans TaxID=1679096 RepID=UPI00131F0EF7|nr:hypothetical protein [Halococcoides cellulosivorans]